MFCVYTTGDMHCTHASHSIYVCIIHVHWSCPEIHTTSAASMLPQVLSDHTIQGYLVLHIIHMIDLFPVLFLHFSVLSHAVLNATDVHV